MPISVVFAALLVFAAVPPSTANSTTGNATDGNATNGNSTNATQGGSSSGTGNTTRTTVITGSMTLKVDNPDEFCANQSALDAFKSSVANLSDVLDVAWMTAECRVSGKDRRLDGGSGRRRRSEGKVVISYTIRVPAGAATTAADTIKSAITDTDQADMKKRLKEALVDRGFEVLEVTAISEPEVTMETADGAAVDTAKPSCTASMAAAIITLGVASMWLQF